MENYELNIEPIMLKGHLYERAFFNWLNVEKILWFITGSNLNYIGVVYKEDIDKIKNYWKEL